ncbi:MAG: hypothetical protein WCS03_11260 [Bacteroidota bacterium]
MKQKIYILGVVTTLIIFTGIIFKINHLAGAGQLLTVGFVTLVLGFIPLALINHYKSEESNQNMLLYLVTWITCFVVFTAMLFKIQHWANAGIFLIIALPFPYIVFLPVFLGVTSKIRNFNINNTVFVLFLLALNSVFCCLLALNVSKARIDDSYNLSLNYIRLETVLKQLPAMGPQTPVDRKIDEVIKTVNEYQDLILKAEGNSKENWSANPGNLWRPDERVVASKVLLTAEGGPLGAKLETGLKELITEMGKTRGFESLAKVAPVIFDINDPAGSDPGWAYRIFRDNTLSWALIYLDGLEANLYMIKASANKVY